MDDEADDDGCRDAGCVAEEIEEAAVEPDQLLGGGVSDDGPAEGAEAFAEEGERHEEHDDGLNVGEVAGYHGDGEKHASDDGHLAREGERVATAEEGVGEEAAQDAADRAAECGEGDGEASFEYGHVAGLNEVDGEPGDEEVGEGGDTELANVDADEHPLLEELGDAFPGEGAWWFAAGSAVNVDEAAAALDAIDLGRRDERVIGDVVDDLRPGEDEHEAEDAHEPEGPLPAVAVCKPAEDGREGNESEVLR